MPVRRSTTYACAIALALVIRAHPATSGARVVRQQEEVSSFALIDRALETGAIDAETAHRYRVFAAFGDTRLPSAYRGDDRGIRGLPASVAEAGALLETFSAATHAELEPFFMRPDQPGSWITLATIPGQERGGEGEDGRFIDVDVDPASSGSGPFVPSPVLPPAVERSAVTWHTENAVGGKVKVWWQDRYPSDQAIAEGLATELTTLIWGKLTGLMNIEPFPDNGIVNNGGDAAFDFYLVHTPTAAWAGLARSAIPSVPCHPARYVLIDTRRNALGSASTYGVLQIATHELMHAIQFAYRVRGGCPEPWIREASADWASNWVYPLTDGEHDDAKKYLATIEYRLDNPQTVHADDRFYGEHLLPYFLETATGGPGFMPAMWGSFRTMPVPEGMNSVMPGGFEKAWPKFLVHLWNRPPVDAPDGLKALDRLPLGAAVSGGLDVVDVPSGYVTRPITFLQADLQQLVLATGVQPLAGHYRHYHFNRTVRNVLFRNTIREEGILHGTVWAIENIGGTWQAPVDLTEEFSKSWCRDEPKEDLEELVLIFGNHDWKNMQVVNPLDAPTIEARSFGCAGWTGTSNVELTITSQDPAITIVEHVNSTIRFDVDSTLVTPGLPAEHWISVGGQISWRVEVTGECTGSAFGGTSIPRLADDHVATLSVWMDGDTLRHSGSNGPWPAATPRYTIDCPTGPAELIVNGTGMFFFTDPVLSRLAPDGKSFSGNHSTLSLPDMRIIHQYAFRCSRGC